MSKQLEKDSKYSKYDLDGDGVVSDEEIAREEKIKGIIPPTKRPAKTSAL